jgi:hypothetical protein
MRSRLFFITYVVANLSLVAYGALALLKPMMLLDPFSLRIYQFPQNATAAVEYLAALFRLLGFFNAARIGQGDCRIFAARRCGIDSRRANRVAGGEIPAY